MELYEQLFLETDEDAFRAGTCWSHAFLLLASSRLASYATRKRLLRLKSLIDWRLATFGKQYSESVQESAEPLIFARQEELRHRIHAYLERVKRSQA